MLFALFFIVLISVVNGQAPTACSRYGVPGFCGRLSNCAGALHAYNAAGVSDECRPMAADIKCCIPRTCKVGTRSGQCMLSSQCGGTKAAWNSPGSDGACRAYGQYATCCLGAAPVEEPEITCSRNGVKGSCKSQAACGNGGWYSFTAAGVSDECRPEPSGIRCCIPSQAGASPPTNGPPCTAFGKQGSCLDRGSCPSGTRPWGNEPPYVSGCGRLAANIQCCANAVRPPTFNPGSFSPNNGRSCQLARPDSSCSAFTGRTLTANIRFVDELILYHQHARAAGVTLYVTSSFRPDGTTYGASRSRHKVGFAFDMNASGCNSNCMCRVPTSNSRVTAFLRAVMADKKLHWGGDPARPINWRVGSCSRDSVHLQSRTYEAGSNYDAERRCLNTEWRAGRFRRFSCPATGRSFLQDDVLGEEFIDIPEPEGEGLETATMALIALGALLIVALVVVLVVVARRSSSGSSTTFQAVQETEQSSVISLEPSEQAGQYECAQCNKSYEFAEDLATHVETRH